MHSSTQRQEFITYGPLLWNNFLLIYRMPTAFSAAHSVAEKSPPVSGVQYIKPHVVYGTAAPFTRQADTCITKRAPTTLVIFKLVHLYICTIYCVEQFISWIRHSLTHCCSCLFRTRTVHIYEGTREKYYSGDKSGDLISDATETCYLDAVKCIVSARRWMQNW